MYTFEPVLNGRTIQIHSNTYWTCDSDSNFKLSKNSGFGNDEIEIIVPETILNVHGVVTFSYGDERCKYPDITIRFANSCYINTVPGFEKCNGENVITYLFTTTRQPFTTQITTSDGWKVTTSDNVKYLIYDNYIMVISSENGGDGYVQITPNGDCSEKSIVTIKLKDNRS